MAAQGRLPDPAAVQHGRSTVTELRTRIGTFFDVVGWARRRGKHSGMCRQPKEHSSAVLHSPPVLQFSPCFAFPQLSIREKAPPRLHHSGSSTPFITSIDAWSAWFRAQAAVPSVPETGHDAGGCLRLLAAAGAAVANARGAHTASTTCRRLCMRAAAVCGGSVRPPWCSLAVHAFAAVTFDRWMVW